MVPPVLVLMVLTIHVHVLLGTLDKTVRHVSICKYKTEAGQIKTVFFKWQICNKSASTVYEVVGIV